MPYIQFKMEAVQLVLCFLTPSITEPERCLLLCSHLSKLRKNSKIYLDICVYCSQMAFVVGQENLQNLGSHLYLLIHILAVYIDDLINGGLTLDECVQNIIAPINLLDSLGFISNRDKSIFCLSQEITILVFNINSQTFEIILAGTKRKLWRVTSVNYLVKLLKLLCVWQERLA